MVQRCLAIDTLARIIHHESLLLVVHHARPFVTHGENRPLVKATCKAPWSPV